MLFNCCANKVKPISPRPGLLYTAEGEHLELQNEPNIFRKMFGDNAYNENNEYCGDIEKKLYKILLDEQNKPETDSYGIVKIHKLTDSNVDIDLLETDIDDYSERDVILEMLKVKDYLQSIGIMYIDWKYDNIGVSRLDGKLKLFDFDASGLTRPDKFTWDIQAPVWYAYKEAFNAGMKTPTEIDDYAFSNGFSNY